MHFSLGHRAFWVVVITSILAGVLLLVADETTIEKGARAWALLPQVIKVMDKKQEALPPRRTALIMRVMVPIPNRTLQNMHSFATELSNQNSSYELVLLVDVTQAKNESEVTSTVETFLRDLDSDLPIPLIFPVNERIILNEFPRLTNYIYNGPNETNMHNETGVCCGRGVMWQMLFPSLAMFLKYNEDRYDYAWVFGDDMGMLGNLTFLQIIQKWDLAIRASGEVAHLVAEPTTLNNVPYNKWMFYRHTPGFDTVLQRLNPYGTTKWTCYTDQVQRHSMRLANEIYRAFVSNVFQFGECFLQPIAWDANLTIVKLSSLNVSIGGLNELARKTESKKALERFRLDDTLEAFLFHES
jgi:hypothetical protein